MARPTVLQPTAQTLHAMIDERGRIAVRVIPGARENMVRLLDGTLVAKVRARPHDGAANVAVRDLLARASGLAPSRLTLLRGATSREKLFGIAS